MRAVIAEAPGPPDVLRPVELPDPVPGPGQVLVEVQLSAVNFVDAQMRSGAMPLHSGSFPIVFGNGVGGIVRATGDDVDRSWLGSEVVTSTGGSGGYATMALASVADLHRLRDDLALPDALALLADGRTALGLSAAAHIEASDTVVITAAASGVATLLVQLAKPAGATVIGLASNDAKLAHARRIGVDAAINYSDGAWTSLLDVATQDGIDVVFDGVGGETTGKLFERVNAGGRYLMHGKASGQWGDVDAERAAARGIELIPLSAIAGTPDVGFALTERALALSAEGEITPTIGQTFPLDRAAEAHAAIESRATIGRTILLVPG